MSSEELIHKYNSVPRPNRKSFAIALKALKMSEIHSDKKLFFCQLVIKKGDFKGKNFVCCDIIVPLKM